MDRQFPPDPVAESVKRLAQPTEPTRVRRVERIVHHITVAVEILRILWDLDEGIGGSC
jgi:hypothetical protein